MPITLKTQSMDRELAVLLVEEHALIRAGLRSLIDATSGLTVVAEASDMAEALTLARTHQPDAVLVGASTLEQADDDVAPTLRSELPQSCFFVIGGDADKPELAGAYRCLPRDAGMQEFCAAVSNLFGIRCDDCRLQTVCPVAQAVTALSRRERQVAVRVAAGLTSKQIASMLGLAIRTVNTYRESLARKLGTSSAAAVTRYVIESGLRDAGVPDGDGS
jgi:DNA-binding NarL/FixJ family response regulator